MRIHFLGILFSLGFSVLGQSARAEVVGITSPGRTDYPNGGMRVTWVAGSPYPEDDSRIATDRAGTVAFLYAALDSLDTLRKIDLATGQVVGSILLNGPPTCILYDDVGDTVVVQSTTEILWIDGSSLTTTSSTPLLGAPFVPGQRAGGVIEPDFRRVYLATSERNLTAFNLDTFAVAGSAPELSSGQVLREGSLDPASRVAYFQCRSQLFDVTMWVAYDLQTMTILAGPVPNYSEFLGETLGVDTAAGFGYFHSDEGTPGRGLKRVSLSTLNYISDFPTASTAPGTVLYNQATSSLIQSTAPGCIGTLSPQSLDVIDTACAPGEWGHFKLKASLTDGRIIATGWSAGFKVVVFDTLPTLAVERIIDVDRGTNASGSIITDRANPFQYFVSASNITKVSRFEYYLDSYNEGTITILPEGDSNILCGAINADGSRLFLGTATSPAKVIQLDVESDITRLGSITLEPGEENLICAASDDANGFIYFGTLTSPAKIIRVRQSPFERVDSITLDADENFVRALVLDPDNGKLFAGLSADPARIVRIDTPTFARQDALTLGAGVANITAGVLDSVGGEALFGTATAPAQIVAIDTDSLTLAATTSMEPTENFVRSMTFDSGRRALFASLGTKPPKLVRYDAAERQRRGALDIPWDDEAGAVATHENTNQVLVALSALEDESTLNIGVISTSPAGAWHGTPIFLDEQVRATDIRFYSHAASGNLNLAICQSDGVRLWNSPTIPNTTNGGTILFPISEGSVPTLELGPGHYYLVWSTDSLEPVAGYTPSILETGFLVEEPNTNFFAPFVFGDESHKAHFTSSHYSISLGVTSADDPSGVGAWVYYE